MATAGEARQRHFRAIFITTLASLAGVIAAIVSDLLTAGIDPGAAATNGTALLVLPAAIAVQFVLYIQLFDGWGGPKDLLYVAFMTFCLWFISWGIFLTTGASIV